MTLQTIAHTADWKAKQPANSPWQRAAMHAIPERDALPDLDKAPAPAPFSEPRFDHDYSHVPLHEGAPLQRTPSCPLSPQRCPFGGACHTCPPSVQAKLTIGQPDDKYEREADRVADQVMSMPEPGVQRQSTPQEEEEEEPLQTKPLAGQITPLVQRQFEPEAEEEELLQTKPLAAQITPLVQRQVEPEEEEEPLQTKPLAGQITPLVQRQVESEEEEEEPLQTKPLAGQLVPLVQRQIEPEEEEEEEPLQTKPLAGQITPLVQRQVEPEEEEEPVQSKQSSGQAPHVNPGLQAQIRSLRGGGQPLSPSVRSFFEPRFGHNFGGVRVHTGSRAVETTRGLNARAFTVGQDIALGANQYGPGTSAGRRLLAHELAHVVQQTNSLPRVQRWVLPTDWLDYVGLAVDVGERIYIELAYEAGEEKDFQRFVNTLFFVIDLVFAAAPAAGGGGLAIRASKELGAKGWVALGKSLQDEIVVGVAGRLGKPVAKVKTMIERFFKLGGKKPAMEVAGDVAGQAGKKPVKQIAGEVTKQTGRKIATKSVVEISSRKMYLLGQHFRKWGVAMGYASKKAYDAGAKAFARKFQTHPDARIFEGVWGGRGIFRGKTQRAITYGGKTAIIDTSTGHIISYYVGTEQRGLNFVVEILVK